MGFFDAVRAVFTDMDGTLTAGGKLRASTYAALESLDEAGSSPSLIRRGSRRGFCRPETVTLLVVAMVGNGSGRAFASLLGIQTIISPRPRLAQA